MFNKKCSDIIPRKRALTAPLKLSMKDLSRISGNNNNDTYHWKIQFPAGCITSNTTIVEFNQVWLQGQVTIVEGADVIQMTDGTGDVKVTKCSNAPGDQSWFQTGSYCGLLAIVVKSSGLLPVVAAIKFMSITENAACIKDLWSLEVAEMKNFLTNKITPQTDQS